MGRANTHEERRATVVWAVDYRGDRVKGGAIGSLTQLAELHNGSLRRYFALAALSRSRTADRTLVEAARPLVFPVRTRLEASIARTLRGGLKRGTVTEDLLFRGRFFGASKKQGVSVRMPLYSCNPTELCAVGCYAHDALDAAPLAIVRGSVNGLIAERYEAAHQSTRRSILDQLDLHVRQGVSAALSEVKRLGDEWTREPYIRFSHVGEIAAFPTFANHLAARIRKASDGRVRCVVYTRHPKAAELDPSLFVVNFTLDASSEERKAWIPPHARTVYSAFGGQVSAEADVNFLEHHRWYRLPAKGAGRICPTTAPDAEASSCDQARCARCFVPKDVTGHGEIRDEAQ